MSESSPTILDSPRWVRLLEYLQQTKRFSHALLGKRDDSRLPTSSVALAPHLVRAQCPRIQKKAAVVPRVQAAVTERRSTKDLGELEVGMGERSFEGVGGGGGR